MEWVLILCAIVCLLLFVRLSRRRVSTLRLPPGPTGYPIVGALPLLKPLPHAALAALSKRHGPIMHLKLGPQHAVIASTPAAARAFLKTYDLQFANRVKVTRDNATTYGGNNLAFANYGEHWKLLRKMCNLHLLGNKALTYWTHIRHAEAGHMVRYAREVSSAGEPVALLDLLMWTITNIIGRATVSRRVFEDLGEESNEFKKMVEEMLASGGQFDVGDYVPMVARMDLCGVKRKQAMIHARFDEMVSRFVKEHAAGAAEREGRPDFLDLVMAGNAGGDDGEMLSEVKIKGLILDLLIAGTDTSSIIIEWALAEMLKNRTILTRLQSEMDAVIGRHRRLEESDIRNLPYLQAVCKEALRMHPSTPLSLPHLNSEPCEVEGYYIPANTRLLINIWAIGRDGDTWTRPSEFDPERFLHGGEAERDLQPYGCDFEFIPFGAGRRICVGMHAGMGFVQHLLGTLVHGFDWKMPEGMEIDLDEAPGLALPKKVPLKAFVSPRLDSGAYV